MTMTDVVLKTNTLGQHSCPTCKRQSNAQNTKGRLKNRIRVFQTTFRNPTTPQLELCLQNQPSKFGIGQSSIFAGKPTLHFAAIANILNFEYSMSPHSVIPAQAGIHRKT